MTGSGGEAAILERHPDARNARTNLELALRNKSQGTPLVWPPGQHPPDRRLP